MGDAFTVDFSDVQDFVTQDLDVGVYDAVVVDVKADVSRAGKPMLTWTLAIENDDQFEGGLVSYRTSLQPQALFNLRRTLEALGVDREELRGQFQVNPPDYIDEPCAVVIEESVNPNNGQLMKNVSRIISREDRARFVAATAPTQEDPSDLFKS